MERSLGQDTKRLQDKEQELEWATEELQHVSLQQFTQQTGTNVTVLLTAPTEAEAPHADIETEAPFQSGSLKWPGSSQQLPRNLCVFCRILSCLVLTLKAYTYITLPIFRGETQERYQGR